MEFEREQEEAAAEEAAGIGGARDEELDYLEQDAGRPAGVGEDAWRPVEEAGGGEAEGFEQAEEQLIERAENPRGPSPMAHRGSVDEEGLIDDVYGEPDHVRTSEDDPDAPGDHS